MTHPRRETTPTSAQHGEPDPEKTREQTHHSQMHDDAIRRDVARAREALREAYHARRMALPAPYTAERIARDVIERVRISEANLDTAETAARRRRMRI